MTDRNLGRNLLSSVTYMILEGVIHYSCLNYMNFAKINISRNSFVLNDESILTSRSFIIAICIQLSTINSPDVNLLFIPSFTKEIGVNIFVVIVVTI
jgi:hypothetical protein